MKAAPGKNPETALDQGQSTESDEAQATFDQFARDLREQVRSTGEDRSRLGDVDGFDEGLELIAELSPGEVVTADIIRPRQRIGTPAVLGSVFRRAAALGLIQPAGVTTAQAVSAHGRLVRTWLRAGG
jgi:hypothetical protein